MKTTRNSFRRGARLPLAAIFAALASPALAYQPLATDDTGTQGLAGNQFEAGFDYSHAKLAGATGIDRAIPLTYTRGITDDLDVFAGVARQLTPGDGWENVALGAKWRFFESEAGKYSLALKPEIRLPVSRAKEAAGFGNGKTSYGLTLIYTRETEFGELHANLAVARDNFADTVTITDRRNLYRFSVAPVWAVAEGWKLALDLGVQTNPDRASKAAMGYLELGLVYSPSADLDLSLGLTRDLSDGPVTSTTANLGLTWRFR